MNQVTDTIARFVLALDDRDWEGVTSYLGETVRRDYTSLFGGEADEIAGPALVAEWRGVLTGLDAHQHLLGPPAVTVDGDEAAQPPTSSARTCSTATPAVPGWSAAPTAWCSVVSRGGGG